MGEIFTGNAQGTPGGDQALTRKQCAEGSYVRPTLGRESDRRRPLWIWKPVSLTPFARVPVHAFLWLEVKAICNRRTYFLDRRNPVAIAKVTGFISHISYDWFVICGFRFRIESW